MATSANDPLPMTVIGGFLGAGKTTLLNRWLRDADGPRLAVLVNDFGAINIDAELIASRSGDAIALSNGCVCCQIGDDLSVALMGVLDRRERFDAVVVEASGVSDPWRVAQFAQADPALSLDGIVVLVDASVARAQARDRLLADTLQRQLVSADIVVLNKTDLVDAPELAALRHWIGQVAGTVACYATTLADVPRAFLTRLAMPTARGEERRQAGTAMGRGGVHVDGGSADGHSHSHSDPLHDRDQDHDHDQNVDHDDGHGHGHGHRHAHRHGHGHDDDRAHLNDPDEGHEDPAHGSVFDTWSARPGWTFDVDALRAWLRNPPAGLLRLKGYVAGADGRWFMLQFAGRHGTVRAVATAPRDGAAVVAIGLRGHLPTAALDQRFGIDTAAR